MNEIEASEILNDLPQVFPRVEPDSEGNVIVNYGKQYLKVWVDRDINGHVHLTASKPIDL